MASQLAVPLDVLVALYVLAALALSACCAVCACYALIHVGCALCVGCCSSPSYVLCVQQLLREWPISYYQPPLLPLVCCGVEVL